MIRRRHDEQAPDPERPSKGERKRASHELQELGEELIGLPDAVLDELQLPESLRDAVLAARRFQSHGAQLRQRQYIGKLMRKVDAQSIRAAVDARRQQENAAARQFRRVELWRDRLLQDCEAALGELLIEHPKADASRLRALVASAHEETRHQRAPRAARELFQYLRSLLAAVGP